MPYLCILVHCKECQHTERSRSIQGVRVVPSLQEYPVDPEDHERQQNQVNPEIPSWTHPVDLVAHWHLFVL